MITFEDMTVAALSGALGGSVIAVALGLCYLYIIKAKE